jgi:hypothetical protein
LNLAGNLAVAKVVERSSVFQKKLAAKVGLQLAQKNPGVDGNAEELDEEGEEA